MVSVNVQSRFFRLSVLVMLVLSSWLPQPTLAHAGSANSSLPDNAVNADDLLQFQSGGYVLGFLPHQVYLASLDHALRVEFVGTAGVRPQAAEAATFSQVTYPNLWPGIDLAYTPAAGGLAKSTYTLAPGANPADIRLRYHTPLTQQADGSLRFSFGSGYLVEAAPVAWQDVDGRRVEVDVSFDLIPSPAGEAPVVGFRLGRYDPRYPLVIDPLYLWHTFYGSSDTDFGLAIALDSSGNIYVTGSSADTWNGPAGQTPLHAHTSYTYNIASDIFVVKLDSSGSYQWHTFYGVTGDGDTAFAIAVDGSGGVYVTGYSYKTWNGPAGQAPLHAFSGDFNSNIVVLKLNSSGVYQWHTFYSDGTSLHSGNAIAVDGSGGVYVVGYSYGAWNGPAGENPLHAFSGSGDLVVLKLNDSGVYQWHTFYGSSGTEHGNAIAIDSSGGIYLAGLSMAAWSGPAGENPLHAYAGDRDIVVLKLNSNGAYQWHTFYGGSGADYGYAMAVDSSDSIYLAGSSSATWSGPAGENPLHTYTGDRDIVVVKLNSSGAYQWHTFCGGSGLDYDNEIAIDSSGGVYLAGFSAATWNGPAGENPLHAYAADNDLVVVKLDSSGAYRWHTFYGGSGSDNGAALAVDSSSNVYAGGYSAATWTGPDNKAPLRAYSGGNDIFVVKMTGADPDLTVRGNGVEIADGDATPDLTDYTDFGGVVVGGALNHPFAIANSGEIALTINSLSLAGSADFSLTGLSTPLTLLPAQTVTFQVGFSPSLMGTQAVTMTITSNDPDEAIYDFAIQGEGLAPAVSLSVSASSGSEADQTQITVTATASANVSGNQTVALGVGGTGITAGDYSLSSATLTIPDGQSSGSVTFTVRDDVLDEATETAVLTISNPSAGITLGSPTSRNVTLIDDDTRGVTVTESGGSTAVTEDGATDTYTLGLTSQPTADVTITVNGSPQTEVRTGAGAYGSSLALTFTTANWATLQTVEVRAVDDNVVEGDHGQAIAHSASGGDYTGLSIAGVSAALTDNDIRYTLAAPADVSEGDTGDQTVAFTLTRTGDITRSSTVDFNLSGAATVDQDYTPAWVSGSGVSFISPTITFAANATAASIHLDILGDYLDENNETITLTLSNASGTGGGSGLISGSPADVLILDDDAAGVTVSPTSLTISEPDTTESFTISLDSQPTAAVTITLDSADATECSVPAQVVLNADNWQSGVGVTVTAVDDGASDGAQVCVVQTGAASSSDPNYDGRTVADVTVTVDDDDVPGVILSQTGVGVGEGGPNDTYTIRLATVPTDTVTVNFTPGSQLQAISALTFAADITALTPQTVTVQAVDDTAVEGDHGDTITHAASGGGYDGASFTPSDSVAVTIADNDLDFAISANQTGVTEGSGSNTPVGFTVTRSGGITTTAATVAFALSGTASTDDYQNVQPPSGPVSFAAGESQKEISLDITGDYRVEPDEVLTVTLSDPLGPGSSYLITPAAQMVITNDDSAGVILDPTGSLTTTESGGTATLAVRLNSQPTASVTITLVSTDTGEGVISPAALVFNPTNWSITQTVTITGQDDPVADGDIAYTIQTTANSDDGDYDSLDPADVSLTNLDDDVPGYTFSPNNFDLNEEASQVVSVTLGTQPLADVTLNLSSSDTSECTVSPASVTLTPATWQSGTHFTVSGVDDDLSDEDQPCTIVTRVSTADSTYSGLDPADVSLTVINRQQLIYLPLVQAAYTVAPDLVVERLTATANTVEVVIKNQGNAPVVDGFWVDVYLNPTPAPTKVNQTWNVVGSRGLVWGVSGGALPLEAGESLTLTVGDAAYAAEYSSVSWPLTVGTQVYAQVDSVGDSAYGAIRESDELSGGVYNNVTGPIVSTTAVGQPPVSFPQVDPFRSPQEGDLPKRP